MDLKALMDVEVIGVEQEDEVNVMLELVAPASSATAARPAATVEVVLDRSGSMGGDRLTTAQTALLKLVDRLDPSDRFGLVTFDDRADVVVPAAPLADKRAVKAAIAGVSAGNSTNLASGLLRGLQEGKRVAGSAGATVLLLSDGHANDGETNPARLAGLAAKARAAGVTTTTVGIGLDYDEVLLAEVARGGQGNHVFAETADGAAAAVAGEVSGLLSKTVQAASLLVRLDGPVESLQVWNDLPSHAVEGGVMVELGDLWSQETRRVLLGFSVPAKSELGLARIAELELRYVALPELVEQTVTVPVHVNVVPGDEAAGRIPDPVVTTELVFQRVQRAKRAAADALTAGDERTAQRHYRAATAGLAAAMAVAPSGELAEEQAIIAELAERTDAGEAAWASRMSRMEASRKGRTRGR